MAITKTLRMGLAVGCVAIVAAALPACSMFGRGGDDSSVPEAAVDAGTAAEPKAQDPKSELPNVVRKDIAAASRGQDEAQHRLVKREPYFFKEYEVYPEGPDAFEVAFRDTESRTAPYVADVQIAKQRFATALQRKKDQAREDANYFRETGTETVTYEYRNSKWTKVGSLFVIQKKEENVNGEWMPVKEEVDRALAAESDDKGWLNRFWEGLTGR